MLFTRRFILYILATLTYLSRLHSDRASPRSRSDRGRPYFSPFGYKPHQHESAIRYTRVCGNTGKRLKLQEYLVLNDAQRTRKIICR